MTQPGFGSAQQGSELDLILQDLIADMGTAIPGEQGSLAWCESYAIARCLNAQLQLSRLLSSQLSPANISVLADRYAKIYGLTGLPLTQIQQTIELLQQQIGTFPSLNNVKAIISGLLGPIFIDLEWAPELQYLASTGPITQIGTTYYSPLSTLYVRVWQPRDNEDNLLMPTPVFQAVVSSFLQIVDRWLPATTPIQIMQLLNLGAGQTNNTIDGYVGSNIIVGTNTTFTVDFIDVNTFGFAQPLEVVDDNNNLQTYFVQHVNSDTSLVLTTPVLTNITNRTYRTLGIVMDEQYGCDSMQFNQ